MLYLIPTPVGNMEDMTFRAVRLLKEADLILCEDTRTSGILLKYFDITDKRLMSHHKFNEHTTTHNIVERLKSGENICLITDAGTPGISDPGFYLVREAVEAGIEVHTLPGATAFVPALVSSGLPCDKFCFEGFLPQKKGRQTRLQELSTVEQMCEAFGEGRKISACREISKIHEESVRGTMREVLNHFIANEPRGEFVLIVEGCSTPTKEASHPNHEEEEAKPMSKYQRKQAKLANNS